MNRTSIALAAALSLAAGASFAQPPAPPAGAPAPGAEHHWGRPDPAQMAQRHAEMAQRRAQHLRDALQLRPDQEPALQAFLASAHAERGERGEHADRGASAQPLTTPERLDRMQARIAERAQRFAQRAEAVKRFYAALTPQQQRAFDAMGPMGHFGHGMHGHLGGRHGGFEKGPRG